MVIIEFVALILSLILAGMWIQNPDGNYEPFIVIFGLVFMATEIKRRFFAKDQSVNAHDLKLYEEYTSLFIDTGVAEFYRQHDFLGAFREDLWRPLSRYVDNWDRVEYEFIDEELNTVHKVVYDAAMKLGITIAKYTVPIGNHCDMRSVKPDYLPMGPTPEHVKNEAKEINSLVPNFTTAHNNFVRLAHKKLYKNA